MALPEFAEEQLDLCVDYGMTGGPGLSTTVTTVRGGRDYRNVNWPTHKGEWEIGDRRVNKSELEYIRAFMLRRRGAAIGFRFRDWTDYELTRQECREISPVEFQIVRTYGSVDEHVYRKDITKPIGKTIRAFAGDVELDGGYQVDDTRGRILFDSPPVGVVTVTGEYDKPARFDVDSFAVTFVAYDPEDGEAFYDLSSIPVIEVRPDDDV